MKVLANNISRVKKHNNQEKQEQNLKGELEFLQYLQTSGKQNKDA